MWRAKRRHAFSTVVHALIDKGRVISKYLDGSNTTESIERSFEQKNRRACARRKTRISLFIRRAYDFFPTKTIRSTRQVFAGVGKVEAMPTSGWELRC
jgi:hypothetical protein